MINELTPLLLDNIVRDYKPTERVEALFLLNVCIKTLKECDPDPTEKNLISILSNVRTYIRKYLNH